MSAKEALPPVLTALMKRSPKVWEGYQQLGAACAEAGPLDARTRHLVKLALALGGRSEGAVHSHARRALDDGVSASELLHVATLAITTLGFPTAVAAMTWIADVVDER